MRAGHADDTARPGGRPRRGLVEVGFIAAGLVCYLLVRWYTVDSTGRAIANAHDVLALERRLGLDWEHPIQDATTGVPWLSAFFTQVYVWGYFPVLIGVTLWLYLRRPAAYRTMRNALLSSLLAGFLVYAFYPCAPPWIGGSGFTDTLTGGPLESLARPGGVSNHLGAMPSFHVGWLVIAGVVVHRTTRSRVARVMCFLLPALMSWAVVATGNHWVLDVPAGVALAGIGLLGAAAVARVRRP